MVPTTLLKACSTLLESDGNVSSTLARIAESRTSGVIAPIRVPDTATPSAQATSSTATALSADPPTASTARIGCHVMRARMREPMNCKSAWPSEAEMITMNNAPSDTHRDGAASPSAIGAAQMPSNPPIRSPAVANAPVMKPCQ